MGDGVNALGEIEGGETAGGEMEGGEIVGGELVCGGVNDSYFLSLFILL